MSVALTGPRPPLPAWAMVGVALLLSFGLVAALWIAHHVHPDETLSEAALFVHLSSLVVGFGAVLVVDWIGLLWLLGRRGIEHVVDTAGHVEAPIWIGLTGLVVSGVLLEPDVSARLTQVKLGLVLVVTWNGLLAGRLRPRLGGAGGSRPGRLLLATAAASAMVSQAGWWSATVIGFLNH